MKGKDFNTKIKERLKSDLRFRDWKPYEGLNTKEYRLNLRRVLELEGISLRRNPACDGWLYNESKGVLVLLEIEVKGFATSNAAKILLYTTKGGKFNELPMFKDNGPQKVVIIHVAKKWSSSYDIEMAKLIASHVEKIKSDVKVEYPPPKEIEFPEDPDECAVKIADEIDEILKKL